MKRHIRRDIEVVITALTRNQVYRNVPRVRIPLSPPTQRTPMASFLRWRRERVSRNLTPNPKDLVKVRIPSGRQKRADRAIALSVLVLLCTICKQKHYAKTALQFWLEFESRRVDKKGQIGQ